MNEYGYGLRIKGTQMVLGVQTLPMSEYDIEYTLCEIEDWNYPIFLVTTYEAAQNVADTQVTSEQSSYLVPKHNFPRHRLEVVAITPKLCEVLKK